MTYQDIVKKVQSAYKKADASSIADHVAIQVNVEGEGEGAFYVEVADKKVNVEPFEYFDRDALVFANAETIIAVAEGKLDCGKAYEEGKVRVEGDLGKAAVLSAIAPKAVEKAEKKAPAKKAPAKKAPAKKAAVKKEEAKPVVKEEAKVEAKVEKKVETKAVEVKAETKTATAKAVEAVKPAAKETAKTTKTAAKTAAKKTVKK